MRERWRVWMLVAVAAAVSQVLVRNLATGVWIINRETVAHAVATGVVQIVALEIVRRFVWRRAW